MEKSGRPATPPCPPLADDHQDQLREIRKLVGGSRINADRGSNYTPAEFAAVLKHHDMRQSVGRTGICYDNAMAESFFAALKNELVHRTQYPTREHARKAIARGISNSDTIQDVAIQDWPTRPRVKPAKNS